MLSLWVLRIKRLKFEEAFLLSPHKRNLTHFTTQNKAVIWTFSNLRRNLLSVSKQMWNNVSSNGRGSPTSSDRMNAWKWCTQSNFLLILFKVRLQFLSHTNYFALKKDIFTITSLSRSIQELTSSHVWFSWNNTLHSEQTVTPMFTNKQKHSEMGMKWSTKGKTDLKTVSRSSVMCGTI
jgi:hypothetical protein